MLRRVDAVMTRIPLSEYAGGFHSARTISVHPDWLNRGFIPEVIFSPRVSVRRICALSRMPLARSVSKIALRTSSDDGTAENISALAESCKRRRCPSNAATRPL